MAVQAVSVGLQFLILLGVLCLIKAQSCFRTPTKQIKLNQYFQLLILIIHMEQYLDQVSLSYASVYTITARWLNCYSEMTNYIYVMIVFRLVTVAWEFTSWVTLCRSISLSSRVLNSCSLKRPPGRYCNWIHTQNGRWDSYPIIIP